MLPQADMVLAPKLEDNRIHSPQSLRATWHQPAIFSRITRRGAFSNSTGFVDNLSRLVLFGDPQAPENFTGNVAGLGRVFGSP